MNYPKKSMLSYYQVEHVDWDPIARIEVSKISAGQLQTATFPFPCLIGENEKFPLKDLTSKKFSDVTSMFSSAYVFDSPDMANNVAATSKNNIPFLFPTEVLIDITSMLVNHKGQRGFS